MVRIRAAFAILARRDRASLRVWNGTNSTTSVLYMSKLRTRFFFGPTRLS